MVADTVTSDNVTRCMIKKAIGIVLILDKPPEMIVPRKNIPVTIVVANSIVVSADVPFIWNAVTPNKTAAAIESNLWTFKRTLL